MSYSKEIDWNDGTSDKLYFSAPASEGNQTVEISSDANAGNERTKTVNFVAEGVTPQPLTIVQLGSGAEFNDWLKDGDTHFWLDIVQPEQLAQQIKIKMIGTIDWGDGTSKETANATSFTTFNHTYSKYGRYRIDLHPTSGTFELGSDSVMGARSGAAVIRQAALYQAEIGTSIITALYMSCFYYCQGLIRVYIPSTITDIGGSVFSQCAALRQVIFEDSTTITTYSPSSTFFYNYCLQDISTFYPSAGTAISVATRHCYLLPELYIPDTTTSIAANSFANMYCLMRLRCLPTSAPTVANANAFSNVPAACVIEVPYGSLASYKGANIWSSRSSYIVEAGTVKYTLSHVKRSNTVPMVSANSSFTTTLTAETGYTLGTVTVKMGGIDITSTAYSDGVVSIASVTGNIEITASAS